MNERYVHRSNSRRPCPSGDRKRPIYQRKTEGGETFLEKVGETDIQDYIQSFADECDINRIVQRYVNGDTAILQRVQGVYTDITGVPQDLTTAFETVTAARAYYESLPEAAKREFGSLGRFLGSFVTITDDDIKPQPTKEDKTE